MPNNKVPKPLASSSHVQSVLKDNTRSQQEKEDIFQRAMDTQPDYLAGLRDLLDDIIRVMQSISIAEIPMAHGLKNPE